MTGPRTSLKMLMKAILSSFESYLYHIFLNLKEGNDPSEAGGIQFNRSRQIRPTRLAMAIMVKIGGLPNELGKREASAT
jgi:hypothetical protein